MGSLLHKTGNKLKIQLVAFKNTFQVQTITKYGKR